MPPDNGSIQVAGEQIALKHQGERAYGIKRLALYLVRLGR